MKLDVADKNRCSLVCVCKISFKPVQVCGGCCKMFRGLTFWDTVYTERRGSIISDASWKMDCSGMSGDVISLSIRSAVVSEIPRSHGVDS